ncbi:MAG TPA: hypothetical protein VII23_09940 [Terriglobales bacterium]
MRLSKLAFRLSVGVVSPLFLIAAVTASGAGNDPCKVLTAEAFSQIMGYKATLDKTGSNQTSCFYQGPADSGGQFTILTETASGPQAEVMLKGPGSAPPEGSGLIGGSYRQRSIIFSVSIKSTEQAKLQALVAEIERNLK